MPIPAESQLEEELLQKLRDLKYEHRPNPRADRLERTTMNPNDLSKAKNPDLRGSFAALRRAGELARKTAIQAGTDLVVVEGGRIVHIPAQQLREQISGKDLHNA